MMGFGDGEVGWLGKFLTGLVTLFGGDCTMQAIYKAEIEIRRENRTWEMKPHSPLEDSRNTNAGVSWKLRDSF